MIGAMTEYERAIEQDLIDFVDEIVLCRCLLMTTRSVVLGHNVPHSTLRPVYLIPKTERGVLPKRISLT